MKVVKFGDIIRRMQELARLIWSICFSLFGVSVGFVVQALIFLDGKSYQKVVLIILACLVLICLGIGTIMLIYDVKTTRRKESQQYLVKERDNE